MRVALVILIAIHGLIHLIGFTKGWSVAGAAVVTPPPLASLANNNAIRGLWLGAGIAFLVSAALLVFHYPRWWLIAGLAVILSQVLVVSAWPEAKAGTLVNLLLAFAVVIAWADARFQRESDAMARGLLARAN